MLGRRMNRLNPGLTISTEDMTDVVKMYPYEIWTYLDLKHLPSRFFKNNFGPFPPMTKVWALVQHNAHGYRWGVVIVNLSFMPDTFICIGEFGHNKLHRQGGLGREHFPGYQKFIKDGTVLEAARRWSTGASASFRLYRDLAHEE